MKASITYNALGGNKVLEWGEYTFYDGKATDCYDADMIEKAKTNKFFKVGTVDEHAEKPAPKMPEAKEEHDEAPSHEGRAQHPNQGQKK